MFPNVRLYSRCLRFEKRVWKSERLTFRRGERFQIFRRLLTRYGVYRIYSKRYVRRQTRAIQIVNFNNTNNDYHHVQLNGPSRANAVITGSIWSSLAHAILILTLYCRFSFKYFTTKSFRLILNLLKALLLFISATSGCLTISPSYTS